MIDTDNKLSLIVNCHRANELTVYGIQYIQAKRAPRTPQQNNVQRTYSFGNELAHAGCASSIFIKNSNSFLAPLGC